MIDFLPVLRWRGAPSIFCRTWRASAWCPPSSRMESACGSSGTSSGSTWTSPGAADGEHAPPSPQFSPTHIPRQELYIFFSRLDNYSLRIFLAIIFYFLDILRPIWCDFACCTYFPPWMTVCHNLGIRLSYRSCLASSYGCCHQGFLGVRYHALGDCPHGGYSRCLPLTTCQGLLRPFLSFAALTISIRVVASASIIFAAVRGCCVYHSLMQPSQSLSGGFG